MKLKKLRPKYALLLLLLVPVFCYLYNILPFWLYNAFFTGILLFSLSFFISKKEVLTLLIAVFPAFFWEKFGILSYEVFGQGWAYPSSPSSPPAWLIMGWFLVLWAGLAVSEAYESYYKKNRKWFFAVLALVLLASNIIVNTDWVGISLVLMVLAFLFFFKFFSLRWELAGFSLAFTDVIMEHLALYYDLWRYLPEVTIPSIALKYFILCPVLLCFGEVIADKMQTKLLKN